MIIALWLACAPAPTTATLPAEVTAAPVAPAAAPTASEHFGAAFAVSDEVTVAAVLDAPDTFTNRPVKVRGRVSDVCQKAGCWMVVADDTAGRTMRVRMKDHGFSVAKDGSGTIALVEGTLVAKPHDADEAAHFAGEAAKPELGPEKAGVTTWEIEATGVELLRG